MTSNRLQVGGGSHIFRYSPQDIMQKAEIVGGNKHHEFYNSRAEHKNVFARYEPATGEYLAGRHPPSRYLATQRQ